VRVTAAAAATIAAPVTLRSEKRVRMCVNTLRRTKSWKRMLTRSGTQQRCARPRGVCRPKQQCNKPSATQVVLPGYATAHVVHQSLAQPIPATKQPRISVIDSDGPGQQVLQLGKSKRLGSAQANPTQTPSQTQPSPKPNLTPTQNKTNSAAILKKGGRVMTTQIHTFGVFLYASNWQVDPQTHMSCCSTD
jgi:hypothetical protein